MLLMIDNYDSFTYNLVQYFGELGVDVRTYRNDRITIEEIEKLNPDHICISPGPKTPKEAGISLEVIKHFAGKKPILGVCLGHQSIGEAFGGNIVHAKTVMHGKTSPVYHNGKGVFKDLPNPFTVTRYHSLAIDRDTLPDCLEVTAWTEDGEIMGVRHKEFDIEGVQYHPESILSEHGHKQLANFIAKKSTAITPQEALMRCIDHHDLEADEMKMLFRQIMQGDMNPMLIGALTVALRVKREATEEIAAAAEVMREFAVKVDVDNPEKLLDVVGTGGDGAHTFNISTAAMFVAAACGAQVAKHGSRSVSSSSGSADVLEALGINLNQPSDRIAESITQTGIGFMYAPNHHLSMRYAKPVREALGIRTIFNILGPLANPARASNMMMGVFHPELVMSQLKVMKRMGVKRALTVWGKDNLDEISLGAPTLVGELINGKIREYEIKPEDFGLTPCDTKTFQVEDAEQSKAIIMDILSGKQSPASDIVALNAGAALYAAGIADSIADGLKRAQQAIASGDAKRKLDEFVAFTKSEA